MKDEFTVDALELKRELQERVNRKLQGLSAEERVRWIREEAARARESIGVPQGRSGVNGR